VREGEGGRKKRREKGGRTYKLSCLFERERERERERGEREKGREGEGGRKGKRERGDERETRLSICERERRGLKSKTVILLLNRGHN